MTALVISVFLASALGSLHCAGMCGAFLAVAIQSPAEAAIPRWRAQLAYHLGRLATYILLGVAAGGAGALMNLGSTLAGLGPIATGIAGGVMIFFGVASVLRVLGIAVPKLRPPAFMQSLLMKGHQLAASFGPLARASLIGLFTTLLPCGWLYAFAVVAAGTGHPLKGGAVMIAFWFGTLPVLVTLGTGMQSMLGVFGRRMPLITSVAVIVAGAYTLSGRARLNVEQIAARSGDPLTVAVTETPACCDEE